MYYILHFIVCQYVIIILYYCVTYYTELSHRTFYHFFIIWHITSLISLTFNDFSIYSYLSSITLYHEQEHITLYQYAIYCTRSSVYDLPFIAFYDFLFIYYHSLTFPYSYLPLHCINMSHIALFHMGLSYLCIIWHSLHFNSFLFTYYTFYDFSLIVFHLFALHHLLVVYCCVLLFHILQYIIWHLSL